MRLTVLRAAQMGQVLSQRLASKRKGSLLLLAFAGCAVLFGVFYRGTAETSSPDIQVAQSPLPQASAVLPQDALARNAAVPFVAEVISPAQPLRFTGNPLDRQRAIDCLALAAMAEAGGSDAGQRAVIQVVLNRVRHPAFAKTICGVVFEGAERATGCQFTFTCDGSLTRQYSDVAWQAARRRAGAALDGLVFGKVGTATHYHTDWVYPYWSPSLDKLAKVDTHLFFRWKGFWGTPASFRSPYRGGEVALTELVSRYQTPEPEVPITAHWRSGAASGGRIAGGASSSRRGLFAGVFRSA